MNPEIVEQLKAYDGRPLRIMEVCGTHTHEIFRQGIRSLLPEKIRLISGPGCPVCVTPVGYIDQAVALARRGVVICTFGDLIRVPGSEASLTDARKEGAVIKMVYSPLDALEFAKANPDQDVVFLSVGFETTTPASCMAVRNAKNEAVRNFSILTANKTMDQAYYTLRDSADAFLYPGHVSAITGTAIYRQLCADGISGVITGFTGPEIITALTVITKKCAEGKPFFINAYPRVVTDEGSRPGRKLIHEIMKPIDSEWRGLGVIPRSGLALRSEYADFDARKKYNLENISGHANPACRCGDVLKGDCTPFDCPLFDRVCTPEHPVGACMVSNEGACSAFYTYGKEAQE